MSIVRLVIKIREEILHSKYQCGTIIFVKQVEQYFYRRGQLCGRCLRGMDTRTHDELSIMLDQEEYDDISMAESLVSENQRDSELTVQVFPFLSSV